MNERIKELAIESKLSPALLLRHWGNVDALTDSERKGLEQLEKFAELIVKECIEQIRAVGDLRGANDDMIYGVDIAAIRLSKHFGVEE